MINQGRICPDAPKPQFSDRGLRSGFRPAGARKQGTSEFSQRGLHRLLLVLFLSSFLFLAISSIPQNSGTADEIAHFIPSGYVFLERGDLKFDTSHPPLSKYIAALPLKLWLRPYLPAERGLWRLEDRSEFGRNFFFQYNHNSRQMLFYSRLMMVAIGMLLTLTLYLWAKTLYGRRAALMALFIACFSPDILAHSTLATSDISAACFMLLALSCFYWFLNSPRPKEIILCAVSLGLAGLSKYTAVLLYPLFIILLAIRPCSSFREKRALLLKSGIIIFASLGILWLGYGFDFQPLLADAMRQKEKLGLIHNLLSKAHLANPGLLKAVDYLLLKIPLPLGTHLLGFLGLMRHLEVGQSVYFWGAQQPSPFYFLVGFLIKTPLPVLLLTLWGFFAMLRKKLAYGDVFLLICISVLFLSASCSRLQLGVRYILPVYPLLFIIAGRSAESTGGKISRLARLALAAWVVAVALISWPKYLSYFNLLAGGADNGWRYLRDSNIDWGQDLPQLKQYLESNNVAQVALNYFGQDDPLVYGIDYRDFTREELSHPQEGQTYAVSVNYLEQISWSKRYLPDVKAGYSIFIYDFRKPKN